jgi:serine/threonine protein phosphatase PrpC
MRNREKAKGLGVWDAMNEREVANFVADFEEPKGAVEELVKNALALSPSRDNTTAIVIYL